jgi:prepilin-type N-terminal cleavage/methylation domain-containing protein
MIIQKIKKNIGNRQGFTLIEVVLALAIMSVIGTAASITTIQIMKQGVRNGDYTAAGQYTMTAIQWIDQDAEMSQQIETNGASGFPLTFSWIDWDSNECEVVYSTGNGTLKRNYSINGNTTSEIVVAKCINSISENTTCERNNNILTLKVTATVGKGSNAVSVTNVREIFLKSSL